MSDLKDRHAVVTGGASGIGLAIATALHRQGARVTLMGRNKQRLETAKNSIAESQTIQTDVSSEGQAVTAFAHAAQTFGSVDILVNNAGVAETARFHRTSLSQWQSTIDINLTGAFLCTRAVIQDMLKKAWGRVVNIASTSGLKGYPYTSAYVASKHGLIGLTRALAVEYASEPLTINAVCPGFTDTDMAAAAIDNIVEKTGRTKDQAMVEIANYNPQKRLIDPIEVAQTVLWLCSDEARSVTGQSIVVAGGEVMP